MILVHMILYSIKFNKKCQNRLTKVSQILKSQHSYKILKQNTKYMF